MLYFLHTLPGLGDLAWQEARQRLSQASSTRQIAPAGLRLVPGRNDIVLLRYHGRPQALLNLRLSEDVFVVAARAFEINPDSQGLRQMFAAVRHSRLAHPALTTRAKVASGRARATTFRVVVRAVGRHQFRRRDIGRAVADGVRTGWPGHWHVVDEQADVEVWASLIERELLCGLRLSGLTMRQRGKVEHRPAALRPALAAALIWLTEPDAGDVFLDPLAGTGTLLVERAAAGTFRQLYGGDSSAEAVAALKANVARLAGPVTVQAWDARSLPLPDQSIDKIATNLPFGKQILPEKDLPSLYRALLAEMQRVLRPGGRLVVLVGDVRILEAARAAAAPRLSIQSRYRIMVQGTRATICVLNR